MSRRKEYRLVQITSIATEARCVRRLIAAGDGWVMCIMPGACIPVVVTQLEWDASPRCDGNGKPLRTP